MIKFNDDNILTGYIKELLSTFNLPSVKIYKEDSPLYEGALYIKDNYIQSYSLEQNKFTRICPFVFNRPILNYTKTLKINSNIYDSHTHEYLGDYLRFLRDAKDINLMSMYNCFSDSVVQSLVIKDGEETVMSTLDKHYKIYAIPVKFLQNYTIALSCKDPVQLVCGLYSKGYLDPVDIKDPQIKEDLEQLTALSKSYIASASFDHPIVYGNLINDYFKSSKFLLEHEKDLKLFIKMPLNNNTSIVILEGQFIHTNARYTDKNVWKTSYTVVNYKKEKEINETIEVKDAEVNDQGELEEHTTIKYHFPYDRPIYTLDSNGQFILDEDLTFEKQYFTVPVDNTEINKIQLNSRLQLLELNSKISHPFADRLIEYLCDNAITNIDDISDNIKRLQEALHRRYAEGRKVDEEGIIRYTQAGLPNTGKHYGIWEDKYRAVLYDTAKQTGLLDKCFDILGYADKDVDSKLGSDIDIYKGE